MKEKIINYIETLEAKAYQSDDYFKQRNDLYIENQNKEKEIERLNKENEELQERFDRLTQEHIEKIDRVNELRERIDKALHKLRASKDHFKTERENNTITFTIRILEGEDKE